MKKLNLTNRRKNGSSKEAIEVHYFNIALDKLKDQERYELAEEFSRNINTKFDIEQDKFHRKYTQFVTGEEIIITLPDIIYYGDQSAWSDFGIEIEDAEKMRLAEIKAFNMKRPGNNY